VTWETASAIAQILGSVAIVITLIYLAVQIRQANRATLIAAYYQITEQWHRWSELIVTTPDLPAVILRGNASLRDLTAEQALRYGSYAQMFFDIVENYLRLIRQLGLASEEKVLCSIVSRRIAAPSMMEWWRENQADYSSETVNWIRKVTEQQALGKTMSVREQE
jgi:hypothetical protein